MFQSRACDERITEARIPGSPEFHGSIRDPACDFEDFRGGEELLEIATLFFFEPMMAQNFDVADCGNGWSMLGYELTQPLVFGRAA